MPCDKCNRDDATLRSIGHGDTCLSERERPVRLPTKYGQGHSDAIGFFQDDLLPPLISNNVVCLAVRGLLDNGDELQFTMVDCSGERKHNTRLLGLLMELQAELARDLAPVT